MFPGGLVPGVRGALCLGQGIYLDTGPGQKTESFTCVTESLTTALDTSKTNWSKARATLSFFLSIQEAALDGSQRILWDLSFAAAFCVAAAPARPIHFRFLAPKRNQKT